MFDSFIWHSDCISPDVLFPFPEMKAQFVINCWLVFSSKTCNRGILYTLLSTHLYIIICGWLVVDIVTTKFRIFIIFYAWSTDNCFICFHIIRLDSRTTQLFDHIFWPNKYNCKSLLMQAKYALYKLRSELIEKVSMLKYLKWSESEYVCKWLKKI